MEHASLEDDVRVVSVRAADALGEITNTKRHPGDVLHNL
jgi:hypothetical protein